MLIAIPVLIAGLVLLVKGADRFVDGAADIAAARGWSPILVGAVVIGFGTSAPELLVSSVAAAQGDLGLGVGNVIGSNVANLTLVLGVASMVAVLTVEREVLTREGPLATAAVALFALFILDGELTRFEGFVLLAGLVVALWLIIRAGIGGDTGELGEPSDRPMNMVALATGLGLVMTLIGAQGVVWAASEIASELNLTEGFVGFTLVALGTSLPELGTTVAACRKGQTGLVVGNLLGSNIFNSLAVGAAIALINPASIGDDLLTGRGAAIMLGAVVFAYLVSATRRRVSRIEGVILFAIYVGAIVAIAGG
ncbi:MAG: calcium/sodium antiporter [Actinobacteria bacterium]|nr:calcium/sodium antiporter [Actinomycetota bacterium]